MTEVIAGHVGQVKPQWSPEQLTKAPVSREYHLAQADTEMLNKAGETVSQSDDARPMLRPPLNPPVPEAGTLTAQARLTRMLGTLVQTGFASAETDMRMNIAVLAARREAQQNNYLNLADGLEGALEALETAGAALEDAQASLAAARKSREEASSLVDRYRREYEAMDPGDPDYASLGARLTQAEAALTRATEEMNRAEAVFAGAAQAEAAAADKASAALGQVITAQEGLPQVQKQAEREKILSTAGRYVTLIAGFLKLIGEANIKSLEAETELMKKVNEARVNEMQDYAESMTKKLRVSRILGKILGVVGAVLGVAMGITTALTAGSTLGLAIALTGALLSLADMGVMLGTDKSFMSEALQFVQEKISDAIEEIALSAGVEGEKAEMALGIVSQIMSAIILTAAAVGGMALLGGSGAAASRIAISDAVRKFARHAFVAAAAMSTLSQLTMGVTSSVYAYKATLDQAEMERQNDIRRVIDDLEQVIAELTQSSVETMSAMMNNLSGTLHHRVTTMETVYRSTGRLGAV